MIFILLRIISLVVNCDVLIFALFTIYMFIFLRSKSYSLGVKYLWYIEAVSVHVFSVFYVENFKVFFGNLQLSSYHTGALWTLTISYFIFLETIRVLEENSKNEIKELKKSLKPIQNDELFLLKICILIGFVFIGFLLITLKDHFYFTTLIRSRYDYKLHFFSKITYKYTYAFYLLPLTIIAIKEKKCNILSKLFIVLVFFFLLWIGTQFGDYFVSLYMLLLGTYALTDLSLLNKNNLKRLLVLGVSIIMFMILYVVIYRMVTYNYSLLETFQYILGRITGGQSDIWWAIYGRYKNTEWKLSELRDEINVFINLASANADKNYGIYKMMNIVAPENVLFDYFSRNVVFTASTQASLFYYFQYTGLFMGEFILALILYFIINGLCRAMRKHWIMETIIFSRFLIVFPQTFGMSSLRDLISFKNFFSLIVLLFLYLYRKRQTIRILQPQSEV